MNNSKTIIFDYGCVISKPQNKESILKISNKLKLKSIEEFIKIYSIYRKEIDSGLLSLSEYWNKTLEAVNMKLSDEDFTWIVNEDIVSWADINHETIALINELKQNGNPLAILSNMVTETLDYLKKNTSFIPLFDYAFFSCDINMIKPDPELYKYILNQMHVRPQECIFIDDRAVNCEAAEKLGIQSIQFTNIAHLKSELKKLAV